MIARDVFEAARALVGLALIKVGARIAGAPEAPNDDRSSLTDHDYPSPGAFDPITPEAREMLARPEPRAKVVSIARVHRRG